MKTPTLNEIKIKSLLFKCRLPALVFPYQAVMKPVRMQVWNDLRMLRLIPNFLRRLRIKSRWICVSRPCEILSDVKLLTGSTGVPLMVMGLPSPEIQHQLLWSCFHHH